MKIVFDIQPLHSLFALEHPRSASCDAESCALSCMQGGEVAVNSVHIFPKNPEQLVVCSKTASVYIMTLQGQVIEHQRGLATHSS
jgi:hypothetical protein